MATPSFLPKAAGSIIVAALGVALLYLVWYWEVERVEVPPGKFLVPIHRWGTNLPQDETIALDDSYKGILHDVKPEGRHFLNPLFWSYEVKDIVHVPAGRCLVLTRKFQHIPPGAKLPSDDSGHEADQGGILAITDAKQGIMTRGIIAEVLRPGSYRLNPYAYDWQEAPAIEVQVGEVGARTLKVGKDPRQLPVDATRSPYVVPDGYRGVQAAPLPPGTYYVNPYVESIMPVETRSHRVELTDIEFPSRDGFLLKPQVVVEYAVHANRAPELLVRLTDEGSIHQEDATPEQQQKNEILQKVILPHIRGYARLEGSSYDARDFILTASEAGAEQKPVNARESLQKNLLTKVKERCGKLGIEIRAVTLADLRPPVELAEQIAQRELARVETARNRAEEARFKGEQELRGKQALKEQAREKVEAETRLIQAKTQAEQQLEVEALRWEQELKNAQTKFEAAQKEAESLLLAGQAEAAVIIEQNKAEVAGLRTAISGFASPRHYAQYQVLSRIGPNVSEIFASDESEFARLFSQYLSGGNGKWESSGGRPAAGAPAASP